MFTSDNPGYSLFSSLLVIVLALITLFLGRFLIRRALKALKETPRLFRLMGLSHLPPVASAREIERRKRRLAAVEGLLISALSVTIVLVSVVLLLGIWGIPAAPLLTSVGILGIALGFGAQQLIRDYLAGIFIIIEDQFGIGDLIETSEVKGRVRSMNLRTTILEAEDGAIWYLRNGEILRVANHSQAASATLHTQATAIVAEREEA